MNHGAVKKSQAQSKVQDKRKASVFGANNKATISNTISTKISKKATSTIPLVMAVAVGMMLISPMGMAIAADINQAGSTAAADVTPDTVSADAVSDATAAESATDAAAANEAVDATGALTTATATEAAALESHPAVDAPPVDLAPNSKSAILLDADTGAVLFEKNSEQKLPPASITKIMTMLLIMEALEKEQIALTDEVRTSEYAASMGGSQIFLQAGEVMSLEEMLKGVAMASANDASVALAEHLVGSEALFVERMNERAKQLGMTQTRFVNTNGLPAENHYSSARDIAIMSKALLQHELITQWTGKYQDYLRKDTDNPFWLVNTNKLVRFYPGADGLKTGYTSEAKFCLSATASKDGLRVVAVVLGAQNSKLRNSDVSQMMDYAFKHYESKPVIEQGQPLGSVHVDKGNPGLLELLAERRYSILLKRPATAQETSYETIWNEPLQAPIAKGTTIGTLQLFVDGEKSKAYELKAPQDVDKASWWDLMKRTLGKVMKVSKKA